MPLITNAKTHLRESWHGFYEVPHVHQRSLSHLRLDGPESGVHTIPLGNGRSLDLFAKLQQADELFVALQPASPKGVPRYPRFGRVESMKNRVPAVLAIADPTLQLGDDPECRIGWYAGEDGWDPLIEIAELVRQAQEHVGARHVAFLGGSAGGFAALRLAAMFKGSLAFPQDPQTRVRDYYPSHRDRYFNAVWPGRVVEDVIAAHPERFDLIHLYERHQPANFVYYRQSLGDHHHATRHAQPFRTMLERDTHATAAIFAFEQGARPGHGYITPAEFSRHFEQATSWWRVSRGKRRGAG